MNESKYLIGCLVVAGGAIVGGFAGIVVGGAIGRQIDRQEIAKRPLSPDNQKVAELGLTFLGGAVGAVVIPAVVGILIVFLMSREEEKRERERERAKEHHRGRSRSSGEIAN